MPIINLHEDQIEFVNGIRQEISNGSKSVLGVAFCGFGKTIVSAYIAKQAASKGKTVWFVCHLKNLLKQTSQAFWSLHIQHGVIASGHVFSAKEKIQVATIGTLGNRLSKLSPPDVLIVDECHLAMAPTWLKVIEHCKKSGSIVIGNSATPERLDGKGLDYIFDSMVEAKSVQWLIENKRLSAYKIFAPLQKLDFSSVKTRHGDYVVDMLEQIVDKPTIVGDVASHWKKYAKGKRTICYCVSIKHSKHTAQYLTECGIPSVHVDGESTDKELHDAINGFANGKYLVLCNVQLMTTGFDLSAQIGHEVPIEACILLRPTKSIALYLQMVGRALRKKNEPAVILDHANNSAIHGLPDDSREWSLAGCKQTGRKQSDPDEVKIRQCDQCAGVYRAGLANCPYCQAPAPMMARKELEIIEDELREVDLALARQQKKREQGAARTLQDLVELGKRRGLSKPAEWGAITFAAREGRRPRHSEYTEARKYL